MLRDELGLDTPQQEATVRDDERNLVVAAAGSGKTRTLVARVRYLLERQVSPGQILAITFTTKAAEEMEDRLKQMAVPVAFREIDGVTVSTLHALGKRIVQADMAGPISVADANWTESLVAAALRDARESRDQQLASPYLNAILNFHRKENERASYLEARAQQGQCQSISQRYIKRDLRCFCHMFLLILSHSLSRYVVVMTTTFDHHKERGLSCPFWDRYQSDFSHVRHIVRPLVKSVNGGQILS